jgi:hypothetical protein
MTFPCEQESAKSDHAQNADYSRLDCDSVCRSRVKSAGVELDGLSKVNDKLLRAASAQVDAARLELHSSFYREILDNNSQSPPELAENLDLVIPAQSIDKQEAIAHLTPFDLYADRAINSSLPTAPKPPFDSNGPH